MGSSIVMLMNQNKTKRYFFLIFFVALFLLVARLFYPFMTIIVWSALLYAFLDPVYERATRFCRKKGVPGKRTIIEKLLAGVFSVAGVLVFIVPFTYLFIALLRQVVDLSGSLVRLIEENPHLFSLAPDSAIGGFIYQVSEGSIDLSNIDIVGDVKAFITTYSKSLIGFSTTVLKNAASLVTTVAFMIFMLYFLLVDGRHLASLVVSSMPIERTYTKMFMQKMSESGRQLILGYFVVAIYQAVVMFVLCVFFKIKGALLIATLTGIASFVPMVGTSLVWIPTSLLIGVTGEVGRAVLFLVLAAVFVSFTDNFLRPMVLGERLKIHPLLIFFAIVGGLQIFGINGLLLGPLIVIIFFSAVELYEQIDVVKEGDQERMPESPSM
jgi:predicted PurR-regulated permease PerM